MRVRNKLEEWQIIRVALMFEAHLSVYIVHLKMAWLCCDVKWCTCLHCVAIWMLRGRLPQRKDAGIERQFLRVQSIYFEGCLFSVEFPRKIQNSEFKLLIEKKTNKEDLWIFRIFRTVFVLVNTCLFLQRVSKCLINVCTGFVPKVLYV